MVSRPAENGEEVGISDAELVAFNPFLPRERFFHVIKAARELFAGEMMRSFWQLPIPQWTEALVKFRRDERQPFHQSIACKAAKLRDEMTAGSLICHVLQYHLVFGEQLPVVQQQGRDVALGIDGAKIRSRFRLAAGEIDAHKIEGTTRFTQDDMAGQRAGARGVEQFHRCSR